MEINGQIALGGSEALDSTWARPSSNHPQIVNAAFLDAHVATLSQDISYVVYAQLMTIKGTAATPVGVGNNVQTYILDSADY
ncbi:MAG: hypothetical protein MPJ50_18750, partial [Pirellulales bacterium]|nr:hypothetical protein [Pirellulales bacterium]